MGALQLNENSFPSGEGIQGGASNESNITLLENEYAWSKVRRSASTAVVILPSYPKAIYPSLSISPIIFVLPFSEHHLSQANPWLHSFLHLLDPFPFPPPPSPSPPPPSPNISINKPKIYSFPDNHDHHHAVDRKHVIRLSAKGSRVQLL